MVTKREGHECSHAGSCDQLLSAWKRIYVFSNAKKEPGITRSTPSNTETSREHANVEEQERPQGGSTVAAHVDVPLHYGGFQPRWPFGPER